MKLQLFRYILTPTQFKIGELSKSTTKREIMLNLLNSSFDFRLRAIEFLYRPITKAGEDIIVADIGKKIYKAHDKRIEDRFVKRKEEEWPHRKIIINTNERIQLVAFEIHRPREFNGPMYVLEAMSIDLNNKLAEYGWHIEFEPLFDKEVFWNLIERHKGKIKALEFVYYVPNLFGTDDSLNKELDGAK